jgi:uncharacterized protein YlxP (DUF503 family)
LLVGTLLVEVYIPGSTSLKDKRQVVKGMIKRVQHRFNVSIVELDNEDLWQRANLGVAMIGCNRDHIERQLQLVLNFMDSEPRWDVTRVEVGWS